MTTTRDEDEDILKLHEAMRAERAYIILNGDDPAPEPRITFPDRLKSHPTSWRKPR